MNKNTETHSTDYFHLVAVLNQGKDRCSEVSKCQ